MPFEQLQDTNKPRFVVWPLSFREAAWKNREAILLGGIADGS
jgi:hypothetical protein